jgi:hypothetical protein
MSESPRPPGGSKPKSKAAQKRLDAAMKAHQARKDAAMKSAPPGYKGLAARDFGTLKNR